MQYKKPTKADQVILAHIPVAFSRHRKLIRSFGIQFVVIRTKFDNVNGRKVNVSGTMEDLDGEVLAMAS